MPVTAPSSPGTCETLSTPLSPRHPIYLRDVYFCVFLIREVGGGGGFSSRYFFY